MKILENNQNQQQNVENSNHISAELLQISQYLFNFPKPISSKLKDNKNSCMQKTSFLPQEEDMILACWDIKIHHLLTTND